ncbi:MAG: 50S ribosomal protein L4 [Thermosphaera sp.]
MTWTLMAPREVEGLTVKVFNIDGEAVESIALPPVFQLPVRKDLIRRAFLSAFTAMLQPKGRDPMAGRRTTAKYWGVGYGIARVPRLPNGTARFVVSARKGHAAFPPTPEEKIHEEVNKKERVQAIASALAAASRLELVKARGHVFSAEAVPIVVVDEVEERIENSKQAREWLIKLGLWDDVVRSQQGIRIRAGRGKMRGRRYVEPKSILFVLTGYDKPLARAVRNLPGVDIATPGNLSVLHLAPGGVPGRLTVFSKKALEEVAGKFEVVFL